MRFSFGKGSNQSQDGPTFFFSASEKKQTRLLTTDILGKLTDQLTFKNLRTIEQRISDMSRFAGCIIAPIVTDGFENTGSETE